MPSNGRPADKFQPVRDLTVEDFTVLEEGQPREIVDFEVIATPKPVPPPTASWQREIAPDVATNAPFDGRLVVVLINDRAFGREYWTIKTAGRVADTIVDHLRPDDLTAVLFTSDHRNAQNFTTDRSLIRAAITGVRDAVACRSRARDPWG